MGRIEADVGVYPSLAVLLASPDHLDGFEDAAATVREVLQPSVLIGAVAQGVAGPGAEIEEGPALSLWAARFEAGSARTFRARSQRRDDGSTAVLGWPDTRPDDVTLCLADPYTFPAGQVLQRLGDERPGHAVVGGLVTAGPGGTRLLVDEIVTDSGAIGVVLRGVDVRAVVSQGCRPIGEPMVVTRAERNRIVELAGVPATQRLAALLRDAEESDREGLRTGLQIGLVADEYLHEFGPGDFLIRAVLGVDPKRGITIGDIAEVGQVVQFQVRDPVTATMDLQVTAATAGTAAGSLLFTCNGRGERFFGRPDHDVQLVESLLEGPVAGAFCGGEIGPVGTRTHLHGFSACLAVFGASGRSGDPG